MGVGQGFGPKPQPPRNPHSRSGTPKVRNRLLLQFPSGSWGQGPHLYCVCVCVCDTYTYIHTHTYFMYTSFASLPSIESLCPKISAWNRNEGSGGKRLILMPTRLSIPDPQHHLFYVRLIAWHGVPGLALFQPAFYSSFKRTPWPLRPVVW